MFEQSIDAWKKALETLPSADLSAQEAQLKAQFEGGLKLAEEGLKDAEAQTSMAQNRLVEIPNAAERKLPWIRALELEDVLTANNVLNTCVSARCGRCSAQRASRAASLFQHRIC